MMPAGAAGIGPSPRALACTPCPYVFALTALLALGRLLGRCRAPSPILSSCANHRGDAILSRMAQHLAELDGVFVALADPTRRAVVRRLGRGPTSVGDLAREFPMTLPSFMKHVRTLESSGLIRTVKSGRVRTCALNRERLALVDDWLAEQRRIWKGRTDRLDQFVTDPEERP